MKRSLLLFSSLLLFLSCTKEDGNNVSVDSLSVYGDAAESTSENSSIQMFPVYGADNVRISGAFEIYLSFSEGGFTIKDDHGTVWTLASGGAMVENGGASSLGETGIFRLRVDLNAMSWSRVRVNSVSFHPLFGDRAPVEGVYDRRGRWNFSDIPLERNEGEEMYYRFDVDTDSPEELAYLCSTKDMNASDPGSYKSSYQYIRTLGKGEFASIGGTEEGTAGAFRFRSADSMGTADIRVSLSKGQARYIHNVEIIPMGPPAAFMGDSITENWRKSSTGHPEFFTDNGYLNKGISGQNSTQILARFQTDIVANTPRCVVICCGTNDIAGNGGETTNEYVLGNISEMAMMAKEANIRVILCSLLPCNYYYWKPSVHPEDRIGDLNRRIRALADTNNWEYVDYYTPMVDDARGLKSEYTSDRCHPNQAGYSVMESIVKPVIDKVLKRY